MTRRMQDLILGILQAQPSLRDSKSYLDSFAPRKILPKTLPRKTAVAKPTAQPHFEFPIPHNVTTPGSLHNPSTTTWDPKRSIPLVNNEGSSSAKDISANVPPEAAVAVESIASAAAADSHTALVKVQGPFSDRQLDSIAEGLIYLQQLGLVSVVVVDHDEWPDLSTKVRADGSLVVGKEELEERRMGDWFAAHPSTSSLQCSEVGQKQERLRKRIMAETLRLADSLNRKGAMARPLPQAIVRVDAQLAQSTEAEARTFQPSSPRERPPLVTDDNLASIRSALASNEIPVLAPYALYENKEAQTLETLCVCADDVMVALTRDMVLAASRESSQTAIDLMPLRLMVINREGGIPSHARGGDPHLSINLASEYHQIRQSFVWERTHPTALRNLDAISDCLSYMPQTSSGVLVTHRSPRSLIANLVTNKAAHSPSLPHRLLANKKDVRHTPTIIRPGLPIKVLQNYSSIDQDKMTALLEASFRRKLNRAAFFGRLEQRLDFAIITGDYQGAAIVTKEYAPNDDPALVEPIAYLDKFAVLPSLQGSGTVDFLWGALRDEVQGLGLLDALNDNGGKGGYGTGRDLVWKSRSNNPVNRWYYERSNGFVRIDTDANGVGWELFWCDAEDKLARLSGERRLTASDHNLQEAAAMMTHHDDDDFHTWRQTQHVDASASSSIQAYEQTRKLSKPHFDTLLQRESRDLTLLPIVAPEEGGRLLRWAQCMKTITGVWAD